jgi:hypothetical protein
VTSSVAPLSEGISVAAIRSFYEQHVKSKLKANCTTADILPVVKSLTKADLGDGHGRVGLSYCQLLRRQAQTTASMPSSCDEVGAANIFISHAWKYNFYEFLLVLECRFKDQPWVRLWIDNFCQNQHEELTADEWIIKFEQHIVRINCTVMIMFPWDNPIPLSRLVYSLINVYDLVLKNISICRETKSGLNISINLPILSICNFQGVVSVGSVLQY